MSGSQAAALSSRHSPSAGRRPPDYCAPRKRCQGKHRSNYGQCFAYRLNQHTLETRPAVSDLFDQTSERLADTHQPIEILSLQDHLVFHNPQNRRCMGHRECTGVDTIDLSHSHCFLHTDGADRYQRGVHDWKITQNCSDAIDAHQLIVTQQAFRS